MLGQLTAQFAIVRVPEHRGYRNLLLARLISALGTWTAFFAVRIAIYNQTGSAWWVSILLFCELVPGVILGHRDRPADRPLAAPADDDPLRPRRRRDVRGAPVRPLARRRSARSRRSRASRPRSSGPACYSAIPNLVARGLARRRQRARAGRREHRDADRARPRGRRRRAARLEHRLRAQRGQLPRLGDAAPPDRQPAPVERAGPDRPHALARGSRRALARPQRPLPVVDRPDLELGDARLRRHQRGRDRAHDRRVRRRQPGLRRVRRVLRRRHPARERRSRSGSSSG